MSENMIKDQFEQSEVEEKNKYPAKIKEVTLVHKRNTKKELHIGRKTYIFWGHEGISVSKDVVNHPDFKGQEKYFLIKEE